MYYYLVRLLRILIFIDETTAPINKCHLGTIMFIKYQRDLGKICAIRYLESVEVVCDYLVVYFLNVYFLWDNNLRCNYLLVSDILKLLVIYHYLDF